MRKGKMGVCAFRCSYERERVGGAPVVHGPLAHARGYVVMAMLLALPVARASTAYEQLIAPIFRARCTECHGEQKQKAKLALHTWDASARGSDAGPIWVAGKPGQSVVLERMRLPLDDEEHMPPKDRPQPAPEEIALLEHWIARGASRTAKLEELRLPAPLAKAAAELPAKLAAIAAAAHTEPLWEFDPVAVAKARAPLAAKVAELQKRFPGALTYESRTSAALHFTAAGFGRSFGDEELAALAPLGEALVSVDISSTAITDRAAAVLVRFSNLRKLRASFTALGDSAAAALAGLSKLESLSLHSSRVTAESVPALAKLTALQRLHLEGTEAAVAAREAKLPVVQSVEL